MTCRSTSRETMQDSALVRKIGDVVGERILRMLESEAEADTPKIPRVFPQV